MKKMGLHLSRAITDRTGLAGVEFSLMIPLMLLLLVGAEGCGELIVTNRHVGQVAESIVRAAGVLVTPAYGTTAAALTAANSSNLQKIVQLNLGSDAQSQISIFRYLKSSSGQLQLVNTWVVSGDALDAPTLPADLAGSFDAGQLALIAKVCYANHSKINPLLDGLMLCSYYAHDPAML